MKTLGGIQPLMAQEKITISLMKEIILLPLSFLILIP
jgi:hypothetical protein